MENSDEETGANRSTEAASPELMSTPSARPVPYNDAIGGVRPISAEEQARNAEKISALVELLLAMPHKIRQGHGKKPCAILMHIVPVGSCSKVCIDHEHANSASQ